MNWAIIWASIKGLLNGLNHKDKWKMSIDGASGASITGVHADDKSIKFAFTVDGKDMTLEATAGDVTHAVVKVNGDVDEKASLVFALKHQILKPMIVVFEFKNVTTDGAVKRYRFDNPK